MTLRPQASHNVSIDSLHLSGIVASAMLAFQTHEMVANIARLVAILAVDIASGSSVGRRHGLHSDCRIKESKVFTHVFGTLLAQWTCVAVPSHIHCETAQMHDMPTFQPT